MYAYFTYKLDIAGIGGWEEHLIHFRIYCHLLHVPKFFFFTFLYLNCLIIRSLKKKLVQSILQLLSFAFRNTKPLKTLLVYYYFASHIISILTFLKLLKHNYQHIQSKIRINIELLIISTFFRNSCPQNSK